MLRTKLQINNYYSLHVIPSTSNRPTGTIFRFTLVQTSVHGQSTPDHLAHPFLSHIIPLHQNTQVNPSLLTETNLHLFRNWLDYPELHFYAIHRIEDYNMLHSIMKLYYFTQQQSSPPHQIPELKPWVQWTTLCRSSLHFWVTPNHMFAD